MTKTDKPENPQEKMDRVKALRDEALALEKEAVREAIILGDGYLARAAAILGLSTAATLARMVNLKGARHADLKHLLHHITGRPPRNPESIAQRAKELPRALKAATAEIKHKPVKRLPKLSLKRTAAAKAKPAPKPAKREKAIALTALAKRTSAEWDTLVRLWLDAKAGGANQKEFAAKHDVGVSTLRERTAAYLAKSSPKPSEPEHFTSAE
jgi:transposase-like protein